MSDQIPDPGEGWFIIDPERDGPKRDGDQCKLKEFPKGKWMAAIPFIYTSYSKNYFYRRRKEPESLPVALIGEVDRLRGQLAELSAQLTASEMHNESLCTDARATRVVMDLVLKAVKAGDGRSAITILELCLKS